MNKRNIYLFICITIVIIIITLIAVFILTKKDQEEPLNNSDTVRQEEPLDEEEENDERGWALLRSYSSDELKIIAENGKFADVNGLEVEGTLAEATSVFSYGATREINVFLPYSRQYTISDANGRTELNFMLEYNEIILSAEVSNGESVTFAKDGSVLLKMNTSAFKIMQIVDGRAPWHTITVMGENANEVSMLSAGDGFLLTSDNLKNITIIGAGELILRDDKMVFVGVRLIFSTDKDTVVIKIEGNTIAAYIDADDSGVFDTRIGISEEADIDV